MVTIMYLLTSKHLHIVDRLLSPKDVDIISKDISRLYKKKVGTQKKKTAAENDLFLLMAPKSKDC